LVLDCIKIKEKRDEREREKKRRTTTTTTKKKTTKKREREKKNKTEEDLTLPYIMLKRMQNRISESPIQYQTFTQ